MLEIEICLGNNCYVRGSMTVLEQLQDMVREEKWEDQVLIQGRYCFKNCQNSSGIGVMINKRRCAELSADSAAAVLKEQIETLLKQEKQKNDNC